MPKAECGNQTVLTTKDPKWGKRIFTGGNGGWKFQKQANRTGKWAGVNSFCVNSEDLLGGGEE